MKMAKISPPKDYKLKPILITPETFWSIFVVWCKFKYYCENRLTSDFLIQSLLATVHPFHYVHIGFWTLSIAIRLILNNSYHITNAPTRLHLSEMKPISGSHYCLYVFENLTSQFLYEFTFMSQWPH